MLFSPRRLAFALLAGATAVAAVSSNDFQHHKRAVQTQEKRSLTSILEGVLGGASSTTTLVQGVESFIPLPALLTSTVTNVTTVLDGLTSDVTDNLDLTLVDDTLSGLTTDISTLTSLVATLKGDVGSVVESTLETVLVDLADLPATLSSIIVALLALVADLLRDVAAVVDLVDGTVNTAVDIVA